MSFRNLSSIPDEPTTELYMPKVIRTTDCLYHGADFDDPCYEWQAANADTWHHGVCNDRAKRAGMRGLIRPSSLDRSLRG